ASCNAAISVSARCTSVALFPGAVNLNEIVDALNLLGVQASDLVVILESMKQAGALQAEMVVI
ncbi:MAG: flagellar basal body P-ring protein FlgI, partial [Pseudomonadota bacterium]